MKGWRGRRHWISNLSQMQVQPWTDCKRAVCHLLFPQTIFCQAEGEKKNAGPDWICPPFLPWPTPKSHWVIELNYCCKGYVASRAQITHLSRGEMVCQLLPPTLDLSSKDDCGEDGGTKITRRRSCSSKGSKLDKNRWPLWNILKYIDLYWKV